MANKEVHIGDDWYLGENNDGDLIFVNSNTGKVVKAIDKETGAEDKKGNSVNNLLGTDHYINLAQEDSVQSAIDQAESDDRILFIPPGTFDYSSSLTIDSPITIIGVGSRRSELNYTGTGAGIIMDQSDSYLQGFQVNGQDGSNTKGIDASAGIVRNKWNDIRVLGFNGPQLGLTDSYVNSFYNLELNGANETGSTGLEMINGASQDCQFYSPIIQLCDSNAIKLETWNSIAFWGSDINNSDSISIEGVGGRGLQMRGGYYEYLGSPAFEIGVSNSVQNFSIQPSWILGNAGDIGFYIEKSNNFEIDISKAKISTFDYIFDLGGNGNAPTSFVLDIGETLSIGSSRYRLNDCNNFLIYEDNNRIKGYKDESTQIFDWYYAAGEMYLPNLPTSDPLNAGQLWNNAGSVAVSSG